MRIFGDEWTDFMAKFPNKKAGGGKWGDLVRKQEYGERVVWMAQESSKGNPNLEWLGFFKDFWGGIITHLNNGGVMVKVEVQEQHWKAALEK